MYAVEAERSRPARRAGVRRLRRADFGLPEPRSNVTYKIKEAAPPPLSSYHGSDYRRTSSAARATPPRDGATRGRASARPHRSRRPETPLRSAPAVRRRSPGRNPKAHRGAGGSVGSEIPPGSLVESIPAEPGSKRRSRRTLEGLGRLRLPGLLVQRLQEGEAPLDRARALSSESICSSQPGSVSTIVLHNSSTVLALRADRRQPQTPRRKPTPACAAPACDRSRTARHARTSST